MAVIVGSARSSYGNTARGDQNKGLEVSTQEWYKHSKGWRTFRAKDPAKRALIAQAMKSACANNKIGYSQPDRLALFNQVKDRGYDPSKVTDVTNCDCSSLVRVCCYYAGIKPANFITSNEPSALLKTGEFVELTDKKYNTKSDYLLPGDIQVTASKGHTIIVLTAGSKAKQDDIHPDIPLADDHELKNGDSGAEIKELQTMLISLGYSCGDWGADGEFGDGTEMAVKNFQSDHGLKVTGIADEDTRKAIESDLADAPETGSNVRITGGNCYVRTAPNTNGDIIGVAYKGITLTYYNVTSTEGWHKVLFHGTEGWVSGKYGKLV